METEIITETKSTPWRTIVVGALTLISLGGYAGVNAYFAAIEYYKKTKDEFVMTSIVDEMSKHPIEIDAKKKLPTEVTREQLLKMVMVTHSKMSQCQFNMQMIKDTLNLAEGTK